MFDEPGLHTALLTRLTDNSSFRLALYVDKNSFDKGAARYQEGKLQSLVTHGAQVFLCRGRTRSGVWHKKAAIVDRRWDFAGGANLTYSARQANHERLLLLTGPGLAETLKDLWLQRSCAVRL